MEGKTVLAISGDRVESRIVAAMLAEHGISGDVTERWSSVAGKVERGAVVEMYGEANGQSLHGVTGQTLKLYWLALRDAFGLTCAWVERGKYAGCILKAPGLDRFPRQSELTARVIPDRPEPEHPQLTKGRQMARIRRVLKDAVLDHPEVLLGDVDKVVRALMDGEPLEYSGLQL